MMLELETLMSVPKFISCFSDYLAKVEFNIEPLLFLLSVQSYKQVISKSLPEALKLESIIFTAGVITKTFLQEKAPKELNLSQDMRYNTINKVEDALNKMKETKSIHEAQYLFTEIELNIKRQLQTDTLLRFYKSKMWLECLRIHKP